jgi:hypothetical protein
MALIAWSCATAPSLEETTNDIFEDACRMLVQYECGDLAPPKVEFFEAETEPGLRGYYGGGGIIFISNRLEGDDRDMTIFHETVHYIQWQVGGLKLPNTARNVCAAEDEAFLTTDVWIEMVRKRPDLKRGPDWWKAYPYCWSIYAPLGAIGAIFDDGTFIIIP